ncbi:hypothetical protein [Bizionia paragorgiae]|jgi:gas vesicle protein|uniref:Uncharacterized protein n=1 Tax=Bizionia paragorgiae TaxID=283786 RepID=A0A1H3WL71_BIZPA|nr:hypothetical protein [Bizionia paragorgiae]MDX1271371.1 hypothetical protein [Bizionia paragorgiae]SDZ87134.1 hypothetical protein SAMN04487990_103124 [Bizionia paragorgiae]
MKTTFLTLALLFSLTVFTSCREEKTADEKVEAAINDIGEDLENASDDVQDAVEDVNDEIEDAAEDMKED